MTDTALVYSLDNENFNYTDLYAALDSLFGEGRLVVGEVFYRGIPTKRKPSYFFSCDHMLENIGVSAYDEGGEYAEGFPDLTITQKAELNELVCNWLDKNLTVSFYTVTNVEKIEVTEEMIEEYLK